MKYAVPIYEYRLFGTYGESTYNIGDFIQSYCIHEFYRSIGIEEEDIFYISIEELADYTGPYAILLLNMYGGILNIDFSAHIIPVFWGFSYSGFINDKMKKILKQYEPVGCRDATTLYNVRSCEVQSFLSGCITMTLPRRVEKTDYKKVFFIDTPSSLDEYIPTEVRKNIEEGSHILNATIPFTRENSIIRYKQAIQQLNRYKDEAALVVTSRLHCASPCIAMGIPVIVTKVNKDTNMGWLERFVPIYTPDKFSSIDWNPNKTFDEALKNKMRESAKQALETASIRMCHYDLSYEFENSIDDNYNKLLTDKLYKIVSKIGKTDFQFAIWGLGDGGGIAYRLIKERFPDSDCVIGIDSFKEGYFYDVQIKKPADLKNYLYKLDFVFITTYSGRKEAVEFLNSLGLCKDDNYSFLLSRVNGEDEYFQL